MHADQEHRLATPELEPPPPRDVQHHVLRVELLPQPANAPKEHAQRALVTSRCALVREYVVATRALKARFPRGKTIAFFHAEIDKDGDIEIGEPAREAWT